MNNTTGNQSKRKVSRSRLERSKCSREPKLMVSENEKYQTTNSDLAKFVINFECRYT